MGEQSIFTASDDLFVPSSLAGGPWDQGALHGGAVAALIVGEVERIAPESLRIGKLSFELLRPIPAAPLSLSLQVIRAGRRAQELAAELRYDGELVCRATALAVQPVAAETAAQAVSDFATLPPAPAIEPPDSPNVHDFEVQGLIRASFASAIEMRWLTKPWSTGPAELWMRMRAPLLPDVAFSPLTTLAAAADFGNGVGAELRFDRFIFINADLTIHLWRPPRGEWIGLAARTLLFGGGAGVAESVLHDLDGAVGRAFQTLVVQPR